jgi:enterochelin esterase family protein
MVKVDGNVPMPWDLLPDIPHGTIVVEKFYSEVLNQVIRCAIYLPPNYQSTRKRFPIFYLLHGGGDNYDGWVFDGNADNIMDYLISKRKSKEIVVVMPDGQVMTRKERHRLMVVRRRLMARRRQQTVSTATETTQLQRARRWQAISSMVSEKHADYFVKELVPFVESRYRVSRRTRAIAGLSMGGGQTLNLIASHPEMFKAAGMFSSGAVKQSRDRLSLVKDKIKRLKPIYVSCGNWDSILDRSRMLHSLLEELKVDHIYVEGDGGHIWSFWQKSLIDFVPYL